MHLSSSNWKRHLDCQNMLIKLLYVYLCLSSGNLHFLSKGFLFFLFPCSLYILIWLQLCYMLWNMVSYTERVTQAKGIWEQDPKVIHSRNVKWIRLHNEELHSLYYWPNAVSVIKSRSLKWAGHVARMEKEPIF